MRKRVPALTPVLASRSNKNPWHCASSSGGRALKYAMQKDLNYICEVYCSCNIGLHSSRKAPQSDEGGVPQLGPEIHGLCSLTKAPSGKTSGCEQDIST